MSGHYYVERLQAENADLRDTITTHEQTIARLEEEITELKATCGGLTAEQRFDQLMKVRDELLKSDHNFGLADTEFYAKAIVEELLSLRQQLASQSAECDALNGKLTAAILGSKAEVDRLNVELAQAREENAEYLRRIGAGETAELLTKAVEAQCLETARIQAKLTAAESERDTALARLQGKV